MSEKDLEMIKKFLEAKKNKNANPTRDPNLTGKPPKTEQRARKAAKNNKKPGGLFDK